jgi:ABC-type nitrate/sulfonate/bicarbonate transport system substrate-binding protein
MRKSRFTRALALTTAATLIVAACGDDDDGGDESAATSAAVSDTDAAPATEAPGATDAPDVTDAPATSAAGGAATTAAAADTEAPEPTEAPSMDDVEPLTVSVGSVFIGYTSWWIADGAGLFEKHGVDVNVSTYEGAATAMASIAAEQIDVMANSVGLGMTGTAQGLDIKFIYGLSDFNYLNMSVVSKPEIESFEQLAEMSPDCVLSVTVPGSAPLGFTNQVAERYGLECERVVGNNMPGVLSLVASGQADAATVFPSQAVTARDAGQVNILYDAFEATPEEGEALIPDSFLFGGMITTGSVIEEKRESLVRMLRALDEANDMIDELSPEELAEITKNVSEPWLATPVEVIAEQWELAKGYHHEGEVTEEQWQAALEGFSSDFESAAIDPANPAQAFDVAVDMGPLQDARQGG